MAVVAPKTSHAGMADTSLDGRTGEENGLSPSIPGVLRVSVEIEGTSPILFHRYDVAAVERKANAPKGSMERRTDDVQSYLYRDEDGHLVLPGLNIKRCLVLAGQFFGDPRSSGRRKQAGDLFRSTLLLAPDMPRFLAGGQPIREPDFLDRRRVVNPGSASRVAVARIRPGLQAGWRLAFTVVSLSPEYVYASLIRDVVVTARRFIGLGDFRPDFGRFQVVHADVER